jgi:hypothetical protein
MQDRAVTPDVRKKSQIKERTTQDKKNKRTMETQTDLTGVIGSSTNDGKMTL